MKKKASLIRPIKPFIHRNDDEIYTFEQYNRELEDAKAEIALGEFYTHEEAKELFKMHLNRKSKDKMVGEFNMAV